MPMYHFNTTAFDPKKANKAPSSTDSHKAENEVENILLALAEDPAQNLFMDGESKFALMPVCDDPANILFLCFFLWGAIMQQSAHDLAPSCVFCCSVV